MAWAVLPLPRCACGITAVAKTCRTQEGHFSWPARRRGAAHPPPFRHSRRRAPERRRSGHPWAAVLPLVDLEGLLASAPRGWRAPTTPAGDMRALGAHSGSTPPPPSPQPSPHQRRRGSLCRGRWLYRRAWAGLGEHGGRMRAVRKCGELEQHEGIVSPASGKTWNTTSNGKIWNATSNRSQEAKRAERASLSPRLKKK